MLQGVGRVVWKREAATATAEKPAGMGVKFIKIDEASRQLIDRLVAAQGGGVSAYDSEPADGAVATPATSPLRTPSQSTPCFARTAAACGSFRCTQPCRAGSRRGARWSPQSDHAGDRFGADRGGRGGDGGGEGGGGRGCCCTTSKAMFPETDSLADMPPPEERTVMRQAAELLEEALRGAGGSMEEVGSPSSSSRRTPPPSATSGAAAALPSVQPSHVQLRQSRPDRRSLRWDSPPEARTRESAPAFRRQPLLRNRVGEAG